MIELYEHNKTAYVRNSRSEQSWDRHFASARRYYAANGSLDPAEDYVDGEGVALGKWLCRLRAARKKERCAAQLTKEHIKALDELGMVWDVPGRQWELNYRAAVRYHEQHGHLDVPVEYVDEDGNRLGIWIHNMRKSYQGKYVVYRITADQIEKLTALGMIWGSCHDVRWEKSFAEAEAYYREHGNLSVPARYITESGCRLGDWVRSQRQGYRSGRMLRERAARLNTIGMVWEKEDPWEMRFALARNYYMEHGNLRVPAEYKVDGVRLNKWVNEQKQVYRGKRKGHRLSPEQIRRLEAIGMKWEKPGVKCSEYEVQRA